MHLFYLEPKKKELCKQAVFATVPLGHVFMQMTFVVADRPSSTVVIHTKAFICKCRQ